MSAPTMPPPAETSPGGAPPDPREPITRLLRDLGSRPEGLSAREAARRLERFGPNTLTAGATRTWPALPLWVLVLLVPMPVLVWGLDEIYRALRRRSSPRPVAHRDALQNPGGARRGEDLDDRAGP